MKVEGELTMDELELSPDSNDLLMIDEDSHGEEEDKSGHSDTELNMDLLDYEDGDEDQKGIKEKPEANKQLGKAEDSALEDPMDQNRNRTPIVFNAEERNNGSPRVSSSSVTASEDRVSSASASKVDKESPKSPAPSDFSSKIGLSNVELDFTEGDLKGLKTYHEFYSKYKPVILSGNPTAPMPKINMVVASKWKEFLNVRREMEASNRTKAFTRAFNSSIRVKPAPGVRGAEVNLQFQRKPNPSLFSNDQPLDTFKPENRIIFGKPPPSFPLPPPSNANASYPFASQQMNTSPDNRSHNARLNGNIPGFQATSSQSGFPTSSQGPKLR